MSDFTEEDSFAVRNLVYICPVDHQGHSVFVKGWILPENNKTPIILVHDMGENIESFTQLANLLNSLGYNTYAYDMRGHGLSGKKIEQLYALAELSSDLLQVVAWVKFKERGMKPILISQGLGALITLMFAKEHQRFCQGVVLVSPLLTLDSKLPTSHKMAIRWLSEIMPKWNIPKVLCPQFTSKKVLERRHFKISVFFVQQLLMTLMQSDKIFQNPSVPTLVISANQDTISKCDTSKIRGDLQSFKFIFLESSGHLFLTEDFHQDAVYQITQWLQKHIETH